MIWFLINSVNLGGISIGGGSPVRIMGILNASPESFFKGSVKLANNDIRDAVIQMESDGADFIDVGGMSTAPYLSTMVSERVETERILAAVRTIRSCTNLPISVDTCRASVAEAALGSGVDILNDVSGLKFDGSMPNVVSKYYPSLILCAYSANTVTGDPVQSARILLGQSVEIARECGASSGKIALDPAIGFFRRSGRGGLFTRMASDWADRDMRVLCNLRSIGQGHCVLVSVSNKSFLGKILDRDSPEERLYGSLAAEAIAVFNGADIIRTHNIAQTKDAILVASALSRHKGL